MHLDDLNYSELTALADDELGEARGEEARRHVAECPACARRLENLRQASRHVAQLLQELDHPIPKLSADAVIGRAIRRPVRRRRARAAAVTALFIAGAAAAAVPGSPVRVYVQRVLARARAPVAEQTAAAPSGIAFVPADSVEIVFSAAQREGAIRIRVRDTTGLRIMHQGGRAGYALIEHMVSVENAASRASYEITLPRALPHARIRVGVRTVFLKQRDRIASAAVRDREGAYLVTFSQLDGKQP